MQKLRRGFPLFGCSGRDAAVDKTGGAHQIAVRYGDGHFSSTPIAPNEHRSLVHAGPVVRMTTSCLLSNYNYVRFLGEAIEGALRQSVAFDEIIVVDDGSTDGSAEFLEREFGSDPRITIVRKKHEGQLSCFNCGAAHASGDIVFFLDADDVYEPHYVERALEVFQRDPACDFLFCGRRLFGNQAGVELPYPADRDFGYSILRASFLRFWIGAPTSCLSIRRPILERILPIPFVDDWRVRADDCLVFGASLACARKRYLADPLVRYRVHEGNHHHGKHSNSSDSYRRRLAINRLFEHFERKFCYNPTRLAEFHHREFCTIGAPTLREFADYVTIGLQTQLSFYRRLACLSAMIRHFAITKGRAALGRFDSIPSVYDEARLGDDCATLPFERIAVDEEAKNTSLDQHSQRRRLAA
ncbi:MAG TPA: glycosyltransferase family 2 protein [Lacipirellulaceae bacterium]|nr:glycosyltransferase family 2 protein [Lacipirellulaceae bacterium]